MYCPNCNNIYEITKNVKNNKKDDPLENQPDANIQKAYYICKNCGTNEQIKPGSVIIKKTSDVQQTTYDDPQKAKNMLHAPYLPRTRKYICTNTKCISHTDHSKREAVFYRMTNSFRLRYICAACETQWLT